jgi:hypothetical protein
MYAVAFARRIAFCCIVLITHSGKAYAQRRRDSEHSKAFEAELNYQVLVHRVYCVHIYVPLLFTERCACSSQARLHVDICCLQDIT